MNFFFGHFPLHEFFFGFFPTPPITFLMVRPLYGLAHHQFPIAQWLEHSTGTWKVMGSTPVGRTQIFSELSRLCQHFFF